MEFAHLWLNIPRFNANSIKFTAFIELLSKKYEIQRSSSSLNSETRRTQRKYNIKSKTAATENYIKD